MTPPRSLSRSEYCASPSPSADTRLVSRVSSHSQAFGRGQRIRPCAKYRKRRNPRERLGVPQGFRGSGSAFPIRRNQPFFPRRSNGIRKAGFSQHAENYQTLWKVHMRMGYGEIRWQQTRLTLRRHGRMRTSVRKGAMSSFSGLRSSNRCMRQDLSRSYRATAWPHSASAGRS